MAADEEARFNELMQSHHYLGAIHKVGETLWYVAVWHNRWMALLSFSSAALKCTTRDRWIAWRYRHQFNRLHLIANNSRFLILPSWHYPNAASRILSLCQKRISQDWLTRYQHPLLLLETFVDRQRFQGTLYKATNWCALGYTKGFKRVPQGYSPSSSPKQVFVYPLRPDARRVLSGVHLDPAYQHGDCKLMMTADDMRYLPDFFRSIPDPRRAEGQRHRLSTVLSLATAAILCGRVGYKGIAEWAKELSQTARARFDCRYQNGRYHVPSEYVIRNVLIRVGPEALDQALRHWSDRYGQEDESLAIDGKVMRSAIDAEGKQTHIMSAIGHESLNCHTQKKSGHCR